MHARLEPNGSVELPIPEDHQACVYVFEGSLEVDGQTVQRGQVALLGEGSSVVLASGQAAQALVLGGVPLNEPVAWQGPFVMNTAAEIQQAIRDYQAGRMGAIAPEIVRA